MAPLDQSGSSTARAEAFRKSRPRLRHGRRGARWRCARQSRSNSIEQVGRLREGEQLLHGVEGDAADRPRQRLVADHLAVGQAHDRDGRRVRTPPSADHARPARRGAPPRCPRARRRLISIASVTACWMARSARTIGSCCDARVAGGQPQRRAAGWPAAPAMRARSARDQPLAPGGRAARRPRPPIVVGAQEDAGSGRSARCAGRRGRLPRARRRAAARRAGPRELAHRLVVGRPAQLASRAARAPEVEVDARRRDAARLEQAPHVLDHRGQRGQARSAPS